MFSPTDVAMLGGGVTDTEYNKLLAVTNPTLVATIELDEVVRDILAGGYTISTLAVDDEYAYIVKRGTINKVSLTGANEIIWTLTQPSQEFYKSSTDGKFLYVINQDTANPWLFRYDVVTKSVESFFQLTGPYYEFNISAKSENYVYVSRNNIISRINKITKVISTFYTGASNDIYKSIDVDNGIVYIYNSTTKQITALLESTGGLWSAYSGGNIYSIDTIISVSNGILYSSTPDYSVYMEPTSFVIERDLNDLRDRTIKIPIAGTVLSANKKGAYTTYNRKIMKISEALEVVGWQKEE